MKIRLGTLRALVREQALVPGRWYGGEEPTGSDRERLGDERGMEETDDRMVDDDKGNGVNDPNDPNAADETHMADHLSVDKENPRLYGVPDETIQEAIELNHEIKRWMLQEDPAAASGTDPRDPQGFYAPFDMAKDHMGTDNPNSTWYKSPGQEPGTEGDPFRRSDPYEQLGFHVANGKDSTAHPAASGESGVAARRTPDIWQLTGGSDTSKMLGANAKPDSSGVSTGGETEEAEGSSETEEVSEQV